MFWSGAANKRVGELPATLQQQLEQYDATPLKALSRRARSIQSLDGLNLASYRSSCQHYRPPFPSCSSTDHSSTSESNA